ncbi:MAG: 50S ribosomal protein L3 N(5)-glutamine methyltransferase [Legionellales bacterium]|nr:50S ribosomal protein L3 N(5)-glutamine methyltransferase [Legionellales bacterium]
MSETYLKATEHFQTILDFLRFALSRANDTTLYFGHGTDNAWDDMQALILGSLSLPFDIDPQLFQAKLTQDEKIKLCQQLERRIISRIPVPYLLHEAHFCGLTFYVDERVIIPRSPLAELIGQQFSPWIDADRVTRVLDLCTGCGCIAIACCYAFPLAYVDAVDISPEALCVAEINRQRHGVQHELTLIESDCFDKVGRTPYDIIVSNPPYVGFEEMQSLPKEYLHEPRLALAASNQGLAVVENIMKHAFEHLSEEGILVVEVGNSEEALVNAYPNVPFTWLEFEHGGHGVFMLTRQQLRTHIVGST